MHFVALIHHVHPHDYSCKRDMQERVVAKGGEQGVKYMCLALVGSGSHSLCSLGLSLLKGVYVNKVVMPFLSFPFSPNPFCTYLTDIVSSTHLEKPLISPNPTSSITSVNSVSRKHKHDVLRVWVGDKCST